LFYFGFAVSLSSAPNRKVQVNILPFVLLGSPKRREGTKERGAYAPFKIKCPLPGGRGQGDGIGTFEDKTLKKKTVTNLSELPHHEGLPPAAGDSPSLI
jgi:hypothetical protein